MPKKRNKNSFNLIRKELELSRSFRGERDWYMIFNILIIGTVIAFSALSFVFSIYLDANLTARKTELVDLANKQVYTARRSFIRSKISVLNDKFTLYKDIKSQNFDLNQFYKDIDGIYSNLNIKKFTVRPDNTRVTVELQIPSNGYEEFPKFLNSLSSSKRFAGYTINGVSFVESNTTQGDAAPINRADVSAEISVILPKTDPQITK